MSPAVNPTAFFEAELRIYGAHPMISSLKRFGESLNRGIPMWVSL